MLAIGSTMINLPTSPLKIDLFRFHKSLGLLILLMVLIRLAWRLGQPVPHLPETIPIREKLWVRAGQYLLYALLILIPISGWGIHSASDVTARWFGLFVIPPITHPSIYLEDYAKTAHLVLVIILALIVSVHIATALRQHYIHKNNLLNNMLGRK